MKKIVLIIAAFAVGVVATLFWTRATQDTPASLAPLTRLEPNMPEARGFVEKPVVTPTEQEEVVLNSAPPTTGTPEADREAVPQRTPEELAEVGIARIEQMLLQGGAAAPEANALRHQMALRMVASGADLVIVERWLQEKTGPAAPARVTPAQTAEPVVSPATPSTPPEAHATLSAEEKTLLEMNANYHKTLTDAPQKEEDK